MDILIIDNYDSFTYNLCHLVEAVMPARCSITVRRNDEISIENAGSFDRIIISPGPGLPADAGISCGIIKRYAGKKGILGVCLGHQVIAGAFGGRLLNLPQVLHGKAINTRITVSDEVLFKGCPASFETGRYHSWVVDPEHLPEELEVCATDDMGNIMALRHSKFDIKGVQFHPESILTPPGRLILKNWVYQ